jgi:hypothetical protein
MTDDPQAVAAHLDVYRSQVATGTLTIDDMVKAIALLRQDRTRAQVVSTKAKVKKADKRKAEAQTGDDLLAGF